MADALRRRKAAESERRNKPDGPEASKSGMRLGHHANFTLHKLYYHHLQSAYQQCHQDEYDTLTALENEISFYTGSDIFL